MTFHRKLVKMCGIRGWKQADLARAVNDVSRVAVSRNTVSRWWKGKSKPFDVWAIPLARTLEVQLDYLADEAQDEAPRPELDPDERAILEIFRGLRDNQGMTKKEARDRLMAMSVEAMERLTARLLKEGRIKGYPAAQPAHAGPWTPGSTALDTTTDTREEERRRREAGRSAIDPGTQVDGPDPPGRPPVPKRGRKR